MKIHITERDIEILRHLSYGLSAKQIALEVGISHTNARQIISKLLAALKCSNNVELALYAKEHILKPHREKVEKTFKATLESPGPPTLLTKTQACFYLNISAVTLDRWVRAGKISPIRFGKSVRFSMETLPHSTMKEHILTNVSATKKRR